MNSSPLYFITSKNAVEKMKDPCKMIRFLASHGADPNLICPALTDYPPLVMAINYGFPKDTVPNEPLSPEVLELIELLLKAGANPNFTDGYGDMPLSLAVEKNLLQVEDLLLRYGAEMPGSKEEQEIETPKFQIYCEQCETTNYFYDDSKPPYICDTCGKELKLENSDVPEKYRKAAEQGLMDAQYNLGCCYESGDGVAQDYAKAVEWFQIAAKEGYADARKLLEKIKSKCV